MGLGLDVINYLCSSKECPWNHSSLESEVKAAVESTSCGTLPASLALPSHLLVHQVVGEFLDQQGEQPGITLIDGYPKEIELVELIEREQATGRINVAGVIEVQVTDEVAVERQLARNGMGDNHPACKREAARERVEHHNMEVSPVITELSKLGVLLTVQGIQGIDGVHADFVQTLQNVQKLVRV